MAALLNRARMTTATTGTGTVTLGSAVTGYASFAEAGAVNATVYSYCIEDGDDFEIGVGTYTSSGTTFSRDTVTLSKISGTSGTSKINLSGAAEIFITLRSGDLGTAAFKNTGTSGDAVPLLNVENTFGAAVNVDAGLGGSFRIAAAGAGGTISAGGPTTTTINFDPQPADGTSAALYGLFRTTNTTGTLTRFIIYQGDNTTTSNHNFYAKGGYVCGAPTGGNKGVGAINAVNVYDDNVLLTDYVFDAYLGQKSFDYSDRVKAKAEAFDPIWFDLDGFESYWREHHKLPGMPDMNDVLDGVVKLPHGDLIQRLMQTVETQAVHIATLNERLKALEEKAAEE